MRIVIPSYNRAGSVLALQWLPDAIVCCCESQEEEYRKFYKNVLAIPDARDGSSSKKRNAVLDYIDDDVFVVDDDVRGIKRIRGGILTPEESYELIVQGFILMHDIGAGYWGVSKDTDPMKVNEYAPFSLTKPFWQAVGIRKDDIRYDERMQFCDDHDFYMQKMLRYRKIFRFNTYHILVKDKTTVGGVGLPWVERKIKERENQKILFQKWGHDLFTYEPIEGNEYDYLRAHPPIHGV